VYFPELLAPLLRSLIQLTSSPPAPEVIISYKIRSLAKETPFWCAFGLWFEYSPVHERKKHGWIRFGAELDLFVFCAKRRSESYLWTVPEDNVALLAGSGAWGTEERKCDDTFELLLLMGMNDP
jgi:hypothetical protein